MGTKLDQNWSTTTTTTNACNCLTLQASSLLAKHIPSKRGGGLLDPSIGHLTYMSKHVFIIKEQLRQHFWQLVKTFRFEAEKIEGWGLGLFDLPPLEASRVKSTPRIWTKSSSTTSIMVDFQWPEVLTGLEIIQIIAFGQALKTMKMRVKH